MRLIKKYQKGDPIWAQVYNSRGNSNLPYELSKDFDIKYYPDGTIMPMTYEEWVEPIKKSGQYSNRNGTVTNKYGQKQTLDEQYNLYRRLVEQDNSDYRKLKYPGDINMRRTSMGLDRIGHGKYTNGLFTAFGAPLAGAMMLPAASMLAGTGALSTLTGAGKLALGWTMRNYVPLVLQNKIVDEGSRMLTGHDWTENMSNGLQSMGMSKNWADVVGEFSNPGNWVNPTKVAYKYVLPTTNSISKYYYSKVPMAQNIDAALKVGKGFLKRPELYFGNEKKFNGFWRNALEDIKDRPLQTKLSIDEGTYLFSDKDLGLNTIRIKRGIEEGAKDAHKYFADLQPILEQTQVPAVVMDNTRNYATYFPSEEIIKGAVFYKLPLTKTNITKNDVFAKWAGGHEGTHGILDQLAKRYKVSSYTPGNEYYLPNEESPIFQRYPGLKREFLNVPDYHGKSPEETIANYVGFKIMGNPNRDWLTIFNLDQLDRGKYFTWLGNNMFFEKVPEDAATKLVKENELLLKNLSNY